MSITFKEPRQCRLTESLTVSCMSVCAIENILCVFMKYTIVHFFVICAKFTFMMEYRKCLEVISVLLVSGLTLRLSVYCNLCMCVCVMCV